MSIICIYIYTYHIITSSKYEIHLKKRFSLKIFNIHHPSTPLTPYYRHLEMHLCDRLGRFIRRAEANEAEALRGNCAIGGETPLRPAIKKTPEIPEDLGCTFGDRWTNKINQDLGILSPKMWLSRKMWECLELLSCISLFNFTTVYLSVNSHCDTPEKYPGSPSILLLWQVFR